MAKAKPVKATKKTKKVASKPTAIRRTPAPHASRNTTKIGILLFVFLLVLTVGALMYQQSTDSAGNIQASTLTNGAVGEFTDISVEDRKNKDFMFGLKFLAQKGIVLGYGDNKFKPNNPVNRAEFLKMLTIALKADVTGFNKPCFADVSGTEWFAPYVCYAKDAGWVTGYAGGKIFPGNQISMAEVLKIIVTAEQWNTEGIDELPLPKGKKIVKTAWYVPYIKVAFSKFLLYNYKSEDLDPAMLLTRKDVVLILFSGILVDTIKVEKYDTSLIPQLYKQENIALPKDTSSSPTSGEAVASSPEAKPKK